MKNVLIGFSLFLMFIVLPGPMMTLLHFLTMAEIFARLNETWFYPLVGIMWTVTIVLLAKGYLNVRPKPAKFWIIDKRYLEELDGQPFFSGPGELSKNQIPILLKEIPDEPNHN